MAVTGLGLGHTSQVQVPTFLGGVPAALAGGGSPQPREGGGNEDDVGPGMLKGADGGSSETGFRDRGQDGTVGFESGTASHAGARVLMEGKDEISTSVFGLAGPG